MQLEMLREIFCDKKNSQVDKRTKKEHNKNIKELSGVFAMTAFARDLAAFVSMSLFMASFAVVVIAF